ncbi:hypothetical protein GCM10010465_25140 [Actinomadura fibrosa]
MIPSLIPLLKRICYPEVYKLCYVPVSQQMKSCAEVAVYSILQTPAMEDAVVVWRIVKHIYTQALTELKMTQQKFMTDQEPYLHRTGVNVLSAEFFLQLPIMIGFCS